MSPWRQVLPVPQADVSTITVHAIVITYRRADTLRSTLESIDRQSRPPDSLLIVDNAAEPEIEELAAGRAATDYLSMTENLGPAGGIAAGMNLVLANTQPEDWILIVDDDDPPPYAEAIEDVCRAAIMGPDNIAVVGLTGARYERRSGRLSRVTDDELTELTDVDYIGNGQLPLYSARALLDTGVFDANLFFGFEELEFGLRLRSRGWRLIAPGPVVRRVREINGRTGLGRRVGPSRPGAPWRRYYSARNGLTIARRHGRWTAPLLFSIRTFAGGARSSTLTRSFASTAASVRGISDGWRGHLGRTVEPDE